MAQENERTKQIIGITLVENFNNARADEATPSKHPHKFAMWCMQQIHETDPEALAPETVDFIDRGIYGAMGTALTSYYLYGDSSKVTNALQKIFHDQADAIQNVIVATPTQQTLNPALQDAATKSELELHELVLIVNDGIDDYAQKKGLSL